MSKELRELLDQLNQKNNAMGELLNKEDVTKEELENLSKEIDVLQAKIEGQKIKDKIDNSAKDPIPVKMPQNENNVKEANFFRAIIKNIAGKQLTDSEKTLIQNSLKTDGSNGEEYILPEDISTKIRTLVREQKCLKDYLGHISTKALTGSFPVEAFESVAGLIDYTDGADLTSLEKDEIKFKQIKFSLKEKAGIISLTNTLLKMTDNDLIMYIANIFARKAIVTYNTMAITALKSNKTVKALKDVKALVKSINVDIDPACLNGSVIITNQDGYNYLMELADAREIPFLQRDLSKQGELTINGLPIVKFSNGMLPSANSKAPIFYGNLKMGASFVDIGAYNFAVSADAGFLKNVTYARVIDYVDCIQTDNSDKVYCVGELTLVASK